MNDIIGKTSKGHKLGSSGAALAILCFFLPWILVSCGGQQVKLSGWELSAGTSVGGQPIEGKPILFLVPIAGIAVIALAYLAYKRGMLTGLDGYGLVGLGALPLIVLLAQFSGTQEQASQQGYTFEYQFGLWGVIIGYIGVIVGGVLNLIKPK